MRRATIDDHLVILDLLAQGASYARSRGIDQWPERFPEELILSGIERDEALSVCSTPCWLPPCRFPGPIKSSGARTTVKRAMYIGWPFIASVEGLVLVDTSWTGLRPRLAERTEAFYDSTASLKMLNSGSGTKPSASSINVTERYWGRLALRLKSVSISYRSHRGDRLQRAVGERFGSRATRSVSPARSRQRDPGHQPSGWTQDDTGNSARF